MVKLRAVLEHIDERTAEYERRPFFAFLRDSEIEPSTRLGFVPSVAHYIMTFADLCRHILPQDPPGDHWQAVVNTHAREDAEHWEWYLADLATLECDDAVPYSASVRALWSDTTVRTRLLSYNLCHFALATDSIGKLVLVECMEAAFKVAMRNVQVTAAEYLAQTGKSLHFFGTGHANAEDDHSLDNPDAHEAMANIEIDDERYKSFLAVVDRTFELFSDFIDEMLDRARAQQRRSDVVP